MAHSTLKSIAAAAALAFSTQVSAFVNPADAQVRLYISGYNGFSSVLREHVVHNLCSSANNIDVFVDAVLVAPAPGGLPALAHNQHWVVQCVGEAGTPMAGQLLLVAKSDVGASVAGIHPVAEGISRDFLNTAPCGTVTPVAAVAADGVTTYSYRVCGGANVIGQVPDVGISELEPGIFTGTLGDPANPLPVFPANWQTEGGPGQPYGIMVTRTRRDQLQTEQMAAGTLPAGCLGLDSIACMPSLPEWFVYGTFASKFGDWSPGNRMHICRRTQGSGTHAQQMVHYARTNCSSYATLPMPSQPGGAFPGTPFVYETGTMTGMSNCLGALQNGTGTTSTLPTIPPGRFGLAIGYGPVQNPPPSGNFRFVKIDQVAPTTANAASGAYKQLYFSSFNHRENDFRAGAARPALLAGEMAILEQVIDQYLQPSPAIAAVLAVAPSDGVLISWKLSDGPLPAAGATLLARRNASNTAPNSCSPLSRR